MAKWMKRLALVFALASAALIGLVVFGGFRLKDPHGNVAFGWDADARRFQIMEKPALAVEGPHVFLHDSGYEVLATQQDAHVWRLVRTRLPASPLPTLTVQVGNAAKTRFPVPLRPASPARSAVHADNPSRLLMLSDIEGEFDKFTSLLRAQGVIDDALHWRYGDSHVALVGDFVDRGDDMTAVLWLIYRLQVEADAAGGRVHYVLGNHEHLAMSGRKKYWPSGLVAFAQALGDDGDERLFSAQSVLGTWLAEQPVVARVGDHLFVHGGISQDVLALDLDIDQINALAQPHLHDEPEGLHGDADILLGRSGLTWYRGMALPDDANHRREADPAAHLQRALARYGAKRIAIGHTLVPDIRLEQQGRLLRLDVHHADQTSQAALYEDGVLWRVDAEGGRARLQ
ncbi:metallophosphoesterase [Pseudoxanthomonas sp. PXM01]|uniref:metallophosphoesterase n=1 Tax=Pseudoxanthomonas sp. PXM01 TaxID=2769295 RepID=UPI001780F5D0|nr:metallophosphoesterase [Pseudoxanthomonas sp. PXM01]MBD9469200.1 metallophosphoesterase [Pseudoxanthomonas sp. PXM01]